MVELRSFDAFPKVKWAYKEEHRPPMLGMILFGWAGLFLLWIITTNMMGAHETYEYSVFKGVQEVIQVNLDISVAAKCDDIAVYVADSAGDRLFVNELLRHADDTITPFQLGFPDETVWCRMAGSFETNRVKGHLAIVSAAQGSSAPLDISHYTHELSFGEFHPGEANPLDNSRLASEPDKTMVYYLNLVPTRFEAMGLSLDTYQYSITWTLKERGKLPLPPGIFFVYDFDPISLTVKDTRLGFFGWLFRVANIAGGLSFAWRWFDNKRINRDKKGLLDTEIKR